LKRLTYKQLLIIALTFLSAPSSLHLYGQNKEETVSAYSLFDEVIGRTNSGIFNGIQYFEKYQVKNDKHKFFKHKFFIWGSIIYNNQPYFETALKYDVYGDELLIKNSEILHAPVTQLDKKNVTEFELNGHIFKNVTFSIKPDENISGFFEILFENDAITLFKKHQKKISRITDEEIYYEFKDQFQYYIRYNDTYYMLKKVGFLTTLFPEYKAQLKNSFKRHENLRKIDSDKYLKSIIVDLNNLILNNN